MHGWQNSTIDTFLGAAYACWHDTMNVHGTIGVMSSNPWTRAARILVSGKFYE